jgi:exopolysaccharide biosynthesis polyprenyl glycosylphosphotransferase
VWSSNVVLRVCRFFHRRGIGVKRVAVLGNNYLGRMVARKLFQQPGMGLVPVGVVADGETGGAEEEGPIAGEGERLPLVGTLEEAKSLVESKDVDELIVARQELSSALLTKYLRWQDELGLPVRLVPPVGVPALQFSEADQLDGIPLIRFNSFRGSGAYLALKRLLDVVLSALLIVLTAPLMAASALLVWLTSGRPVLFAQKRVGQNGEPFTIYKLRSMRPDTPKYAETPRDLEDSRITAVGKVLRYFDIDELPQLFNVLTGRMSLVGPRPEMPQLVEEYEDIHRLRLLTKPGITGLWQLSEDRNSPIHKAVDYDIYYMEKQSLALDIVIIVDTALYLLGKLFPL